MRGLLPALLLLLAGCITGPGAGAELPLGDAAAFASDVQPVLEASCANPSCHGTADRPLETFARFQHRLDPARVHLDEPITDAELDANRYAVAALLAGFDAAADSPLLTKPLAEAAGGSEHVGGACFGDAAEPGSAAIERWADAAIEALEDDLEDDP